MSTDLLEHFNNIEVKDWDLYHHNIGLKPTSKYKQGFIIKYGGYDYRIYDSFGNTLSSIRISGAISQKAYPIPSRGLILMVSMTTDSTYYLEMFVVKTGAKLFTWSTGSASGIGLSVDVFENGDIVILNNGNGKLTILDYNGVLKQEVLNMVGAGTPAHQVFVNSKRNVIAVANHTTKVISIYNRNQIGTKVARITVPGIVGAQHIKGFTSNGNLLDGITSTTDLFKIYKIDYMNNVVISSVQTNIQVQNASNTFVRSIKDKAFVIRHHATSIRQLVEIDEDDSSIVTTSLPSSMQIWDVDDNFIYAFDINNFKVYKRKDLSLVLTIPSTESTKMVWSTKGRYENFRKYW